jgi:hypothetical protein
MDEGDAGVVPLRPTYYFSRVLPPPIPPARTAGPPSLRSVAAARRIGAEQGVRTPDVWEVARDFFRYEGIV